MDDGYPSWGIIHSLFPGVSCAPHILQETEEYDGTVATCGNQEQRTMSPRSSKNRVLFSAPRADHCHHPVSHVLRHQRGEFSSIKNDET